MYSNDYHNVTILDTAHLWNPGGWYSEQKKTTRVKISSNFICVDAVGSRRTIRLIKTYSIAYYIVPKLVMKFTLHCIRV